MSDFHPGSVRDIFTLFDFPDLLFGTQWNPAWSVATMYVILSSLVSYPYHRPQTPADSCTESQIDRPPILHALRRDDNRLRHLL